jgi:hypothetical protein
LDGLKGDDGFAGHLEVALCNPRKKANKHNKRK